MPLTRSWAEENIRDAPDTSMLILGIPRSGKTFWALSLVYTALKQGWFDKIYICAPSMFDEQDGAYGFLCSRDEAVISCEYTDEMAEAIAKQRAAAMAPVKKAQDEKERAALFDKCVRACVIYDDSTDYAASLTRSRGFLKTLIKRRHWKTSIWLISHGLRGIFTTVTRANIDFFVLGNQVDGRALESVYHEYMRLMPRGDGLPGARWPALADFLEEFMVNVKQGRLMVLDLPGRKVLYTDVQPEIAAVKRALANPKDPIMYPPTKFKDIQRIARQIEGARANAPPPPSRRKTGVIGPGDRVVPGDFRASAIARLRGRYKGLTRLDRNLKARDVSSEED